MTDNGTRIAPAVLIAGAGILLIAATAVIAILSPQFEYGSPMLERPIRLFVAVLMIAGAIYVGAILAILKRPPSSRLLIFVVAAGLCMRAAMFASEPILEDDFYRYLWDGGVVANGHNPYRYAPATIRSLDANTPPSLQTLAVESGVILTRVNHPELTTTYPPVAQAAFALAHIVRPWNLLAWRGVLLLFDLAALGLILGILRLLGRPLHHAAIYWWNPLLLKETFNTAHMDIVIIPFLLAALLFTLRNAPLRSAIGLALATATKIWPILVLPLLARVWPVGLRRSIVVCVFALVLAGALNVPLIVSASSTDEPGVVAYGRVWEMNDALFMVFHSAVNALVGAFTPEPNEQVVNIVSRAVVFTTLIAFIGWISWRRPRDNSDLCNRLVLVVGIMFLLSPTQFPWYYVWLLPLLCFHCRISFLVLTVMLPMYYLKFYYDALDDVDFFHNRLVWVEYAPTFLLLIWESLTRRRFADSLPNHAK